MENGGDVELGEASKWYELFHDLILRQHESRGRVQTKAITLMGFEIVLVGLLFNVFKGQQWQIVIAPMSCLLVSWIMLMRGYMIRIGVWGEAPDIDWLLTCVQEKRQLPEVLIKASKDMAVAFNENEKVLASMSKFINWAIWILLVGCVSAAIILFAHPLIR